jgi:hypothetical protein
VHEVRRCALGGGREQIGCEGPARGEQAAHVCVEHLVPLGRVGLLERRRQHHAGVRHDEVDPAQLVAYRSGGPLDGVPVAHVSRDPGDVGLARVAELGGEVAQPLLAPADERDRRPVRGKPAGGRRPDAAGGARYHGDATGERKADGLGVFECGGVGHGSHGGDRPAP